MTRFDLTARELALLRGAARGETAAQTAETIGVSATYARQLRQDVLKKIGASNMTNAVALYLGGWRS